MKIVNTALGEFPESCVECLHLYVCERRRALERVNQMFLYAKMNDEEAPELGDLGVCHYFLNRDDFRVVTKRRET